MGEAGRLRDFLREHSGLPGPRGNLELAGQFADLLTSLAGGPHPAAAWKVAAGLASVGPEEAPTDDPGEFLAFCGTLASTGFIGDPARWADVWLTIRRAGEDPRWRLREAAAQSIQRAVPLDGARWREVLEEWAARGGWMLMRAVVAGVADPPLLADREFAAEALRLHELVVDRFIVAVDRRTPGGRVLRQGLGFSLSVVVAALPEEGLSLLRRLVVPADPDLMWILRSNLAKARLIRCCPAEVEALRRLLPG